MSITSIIIKLLAESENEARNERKSYTNELLKAWEKSDSLKVNAS
jgi:hypothetical protein